MWTGCGVVDGRPHYRWRATENLHSRFSHFANTCWLASAHDLNILLMRLGAAHVEQTRHQNRRHSHISNCAHDDLPDLMTRLTKR